MSHHMGSDPAKLGERVSKIEAALDGLLLTANDHNLKELYDVVTSESIYSMADELVTRATERLPAHRVEVAAIARYFAAGADQREATKFGVILLAVSGERSDARLLETLAGHDEFSLFAAVALSRLVDDPEQCLWRMAQKVHGWGRVHLVERLDGTLNPAIQDWLLREGFRNSIMDNYLAEICARTGKLHEVLQQTSIDLPLLDSAAGLLAALLESGPSAGMDDYENAPEAIEGYLNQLARGQDLKLTHFLTVDRILEFLNDDSSWEKRLANNWRAELRQSLRNACEQILGRKAWQAKVEQELRSSDHATFHNADLVAAKLGMDTWAIHFARVQESPLEGGWYRLMQLTDETSIDQVLTYAAQVLPLAEIASGPGNSLGFGPEFKGHRVLDWILQDLRRFPEHGWPFIAAGLQSPVVRNRNMALTALLAWPRERWPANAFSLLQQANRAEPDSTLKERLAQAIQVQ